ncbi:MAG TPA: hypothetical protein VI485_13775 [Vicinamibacterales bacterium]|nr:hypothetical protein [Vicinamibacterales bacterium]
MDNSQLSAKSDANQRQEGGEELLRQVFEQAGWRVSRPPSNRHGPHPDFIVRRPGASYAVELKVGPEGRSDRLVPLWSQACLQAAHVARDHAPLAVVAAPQIAPRVADHILKFAEQYAPDAAAGVIDFAGLRLFRGPHLESLNAEASVEPALESHAPKEQPHLFSDLNQWMLKVLLAPELPDELLSAPRGRYGNASQLARAANVSVMSAFRFVQQLQRDGYLHESGPDLKLVRRDDLFRRWQAAALRRVNEAPMRFLLRGSDTSAPLQRMLDSGRACLALFAASDALGFGFVHGVPPYVYVRRLGPVSLSAWKNLVPVAPGEPPDVIVRQAPSPESVFRGVVRPRGVASCDVLQVWLDVSAHPARGQEQADLIRNRVLNPVIQGSERG